MLLHNPHPTHRTTLTLADAGRVRTWSTEARAALGLDATSRVVAIPTEGTTDPARDHALVGREPAAVGSTRDVAAPGVAAPGVAAPDEAGAITSLVERDERVAPYDVGFRAPA